jgi:hypothetical protein
MLQKSFFPEIPPVTDLLFWDDFVRRGGDTVIDTRLDDLGDVLIGTQIDFRPLIAVDSSPCEEGNLPLLGLGCHVNLVVDFCDGENESFIPLPGCRVETGFPPDRLRGINSISELSPEDQENLVSSTVKAYKHAVSLAERTMEVVYLVRLANRT